MSRAPRKPAGKQPALVAPKQAAKTPRALAPPSTPPPDLAARAIRKQQKRGRARERAAFLRSRLGIYDQRALDAAMARVLAAPRDVGAGDRVPRALPVNNVRRWVPIGPSVVRRGQAEGSPRVSGRVRDLAVSPDGMRAYAASAKGGVWYTEDAGSTWEPVGGWADRSARAGGDNNAQSCGCLLVSFGAMAALDYVMVGTGELIPWISPSGAQTGGIGVLAGLAPTVLIGGLPPWEADSGIAQLEGAGIFRMARHPASVAGDANPGPTADRVVAATSIGLFLGTRGPIPGPPARDGFTWAKLGALDAFNGGVPRVTDVLWLAGGANGRLVVAINSSGVAFSDNLGASWTWVTNLAAAAAASRLSLASATATRLYVVGEQPAGTAVLWQIPDISVAAPAATIVPGIPAGLFGTQANYDQAIAVENIAGNDRIYLGGSTVQALAGGEWSASLWCFDTPAPPGAPALVSTPRISDQGVPPAAGADQAGLIGNNVHADVHAIRLAGAAGQGRLVWVGCDGGVFISGQAGRCNSFLSRSTGMAALEVGFHASHPTSSHFLAIGCQDNGTQVRAGDTVWEETLTGDGGGVAFHPLQSQILVAEYTGATWLGRPIGPYVDPLHRVGGGAYEPAVPDREWSAAAFYSGPSSVRLSATVGRIAVGTNRVWITDDLGTAATNSWRALPVPIGPAVDPRPGGGDAQQAFGVPPGALGAVIQLRWTSGRDLLALYARGLVRYTENAAAPHSWTATVLIPGTPGAPNPANTTLTDIFPVPESRDFYLTTTGERAAPPIETCWFFSAAGPTFTATNLRHALDNPGPPVVLGPLDPAYAVAVDPAAPTQVYVGTVTGVWRRDMSDANGWKPFVNGLPQATVQDLGFWTDPAGAAGSPRLLRAAIQARGMWEVNLAADEAQRTYVRVHARDDRRMFPTPLRNPRRNPIAPLEATFASPDIVVRPAPIPLAAAAPAWRLPAGTTMKDNTAPPYQLWTFQTAFRWIYPSIAANGEWSDQLGDLIQLHRSGLPPMPAGRFIDKALWDAVVGGTRLAANGAVSANPADPLAVFRDPWQSATALTIPATEVDLMELVVPPRVLVNVWQVFREPCVVDVLIHHRDTRPLAANDAFVLLVWREAATVGALTGLDPTDILAYAQSVAVGGAAPPPAGWNLVVPVAGGQLSRLPVRLDARLPRAVSIPVDFSGVTANNRVLITAFVGSSVDLLTAPVVGTPATMSALVRAWPYVATRLVLVTDRT